MPISSKYLFVVNMDVDADKEAIFNEVYDTEHIPNLLKVPGVRAAVLTGRDGLRIDAASQADQRLFDALSLADFALLHRSSSLDKATMVDTMI